MSQSPSASNWLGATIQGGSGLLGSLFSGWFGKKRAKQQNAFAREMYQKEMDYNTSEREAAQTYNTSEREAAQAYNTSEREAQNDWNYQMWQEQNEYDSPAAQRQRLIEAGYNPLMLNGFSQQSSPIDGASNSSIDGSSISSDGVSAPELVPEAFDFSVSEGVQIMRELANIGLVNAETKKTEQEAIAIPEYLFNDSERMKAETEYKRYAAEILAKQLPYAGRKAKWEARLVKAQEAYFKALKDVQDSTKKQLDYELERAPEITDAKISLMKSQSDYYNRLVEESIHKLPLELKEIASEIAVNNSLARSNNASARLTNLNADLVEKYGEAEAQAGLQAFQDAHVQAQTQLVIQTLGFKQDRREEISQALRLLDFRTTGELADYLQFLKDIKDKSYVAPGRPEHWYDQAGPILGIATSAAFMYMMKGRGGIAPQSKTYSDMPNIPVLKGY